jgi:hypothetical protein
MVVIQSSTSTLVTTIFIPTIVIFLPVTISAFPQATNMNESINNSDILPYHLTQNMTQPSNQTDEQVRQDANQTNESSKVNANDTGYNNNDITKNLRKNLT